MTKLEKDFVFKPFMVSHLANVIKDLVTTKDDVVVERIPGKFWTVGTASYKDKDRLGGEYEYVAETINHRLIHLMPHLYGFFLSYFADLLGKPTAFMPGCSMPGFHVFKYCPEFEQPLARPHVDVPFNKFDWGIEHGYDGIFTPVVPVEMPKGGGMRVWDITAEEIHERGVDAVLAESKHKPWDLFIDHKVNRMCIHSGKYVHQIDPFKGPTDTWRITLQGHAVLIDGVWYFYW